MATFKNLNKSNIFAENLNKMQIGAGKTMQFLAFFLFCGVGRLKLEFNSHSDFMQTYFSKF